MRRLTVHELLTGLRDQLVDHGHGLRFSLQVTTKHTGQSHQTVKISVNLYLQRLEKPWRRWLPSY